MHRIHLNFLAEGFLASTRVLSRQPLGLLSVYLALLLIAEGFLGFDLGFEPTAPWLS